MLPRQASICSFPPWSIRLPFAVPFPVSFHPIPTGQDIEGACVPQGDLVSPIGGDKPPGNIVALFAKRVGQVILYVERVSTDFVRPDMHPLTRSGFLFLHFGICTLRPRIG